MINLNANQWQCYYYYYYNFYYYYGLLQWRGLRNDGGGVDDTVLI